MILKYPILGINPLQLPKVNNILSLHPDLEPGNILLAAGGLS